MMKRLNIYNKIFLLICTVLILFIIFNVPHENNVPESPASQIERSTN